MDLSEAPFGLEQRINNALVNTLRSHSVYGKLRSVERVGESENFFLVQMELVNAHYLVRALVFDTPYEATLFLDANAFRFLVLDPMTSDVRNAIKDYHSIGHAGHTPEPMWPDGVIPWNPIL